MKVIENFAEVIAKTTGMVRDEAVQGLAQQCGLHVLDVTWEDTARFDNSAVGPNISDMTIQVQHKLANSDEYELSCMPVIRFPNFSDLSGDISPDQFFLLMGNEKEKPLEKITLRELLGNLRAYLTDSSSWKGDGTSLLADERDSHVLVSAQACFLPIPKDGIAEFNPVLFNYQSRAGDPAVLTILATREGTSITVIDNERDAFEAGGTWGQRLFFNQNGERASLTGQRKSDFLAEANSEATGKSTGSPTPDDREGLNLVLLIQVPLKQKEPMRSVAYAAGDTGIMYCDAAAPSDVEEAVIGHGKVEGPFTEIDGLEIERDDQYPIRVTVQFYKATSNGVVSEQDMADIAEQINKVYKQADYVGSLVVEGPTGRPTEYHGMHVEPPHWWDAFWKRHCENTGQTREDAIEMLRKLLGEDWQEASLEQAEQAVARRHRRYTAYYRIERSKEHGNMRPEALKLELREAALNYARKRNLTIDESPTSAVIFFNLGANIHPESFEAITGRDAWHVRTQKRHPNVADALEMQSSNSSDALLMSIFCHPNIREWKGVRNLMADTLDQVCFGFNAEVCVNSGQADATEIDMALTGALCEAKLTEADFTAKSSDAVERYDGLQEAFHIAELSRVREQQYDNYQIIRNLLASIQHGKRHLMLCDERRPDLVRRYMQTVACLKHIEHRKKCAVIFWQEIARACGESLRSWLDEKYGIS